jgi:hypothetical protein
MTLGGSLSAADLAELGNGQARSQAAADRDYAEAVAKSLDFL